MLVGLSNKEEAKQIDIRQLQKQNIYFFVEMYEKNNCLEFL